ncbi:MAG: cysteine desulfurase family protein [Fibrobacterota bacterium]
MLYFDTAATTRPRKEVLETYTAVNRSFWANPHSLHHQGERAEQLLEQARMQVTELVGGTDTHRTVFTSGATESSNTVIKGVASRFDRRGRHMISSNSEHPATEECLRVLETRGWEITRLPVDDAGRISAAQVAAALRPDTVLVTLIWVNNESGAITPIHEISSVVQRHQAFFHVDAVQGIGKFPFSLQEYPVDFLSLSAHKFGGLKGSGALILPERTPLTPLIHGGGQEDGFRSGTADTPRAAALAKALRLACTEAEASLSRARTWSQLLRQGLDPHPQITINSDAHGSPYILNCSVTGVKPETLLHGLARQDICISTVSACSSGSTPRSEIIYAMTGDDRRARQALRISPGPAATEQEIRSFLDIFSTTLKTLKT